MDVATTKSSDRELRTELTLSAPRDLVWRAFTESELIASWWARGNDMIVERFEVRPGGHWRFVEHAPDGAFGFEGRFAEVDPPKRLAQTFEWDGAPGHVSVTTVDFEELGPSRTGVIETTLFMTAEDAEAMLSSGMLQGMRESYEALERLLVQGQSGDSRR
jgi:uncharacterized protein YndB with AHSA1/START domain